MGSAYGLHSVALSGVQNTVTNVMHIIERTMLNVSHQQQLQVTHRMILALAELPHVAMQRGLLTLPKLIAVQ